MKEIKRLIKNSFLLFFKLSSFYFFYFAAVGVYIIFLPKVLKDIGYSASDIGVVLALAPLMRFATPFLFLKHIKLTQKLFKSVLVLSVFSALMFYVTIEYFYLFMINNAILGIGLSIILPYIEVIALKELGNRYGKSRLFGSIGFMVIGLVLANYLSSTDIAIHYYFVLTLLTAFFAISLLQYDTKHDEIKDSEKFSLVKYWPFWVSIFLMQVSFGGFYNFFTIYESAHGIDLQTISYLWAFGVICEIIIFYFQSPFLKLNLLFLIKLSIALTTVRWFLLYLYPDSLYISFLTQSFHAFSFGLYHSAVILYLYKLYDDKKLAQQFMLGIAYGLGGFVGAVSAGVMYGEYLFLYSGFISALALYIMIIFRADKV